jgi:DNA-binding NarL/FixJ family response regulator
MINGTVRTKIRIIIADPTSIRRDIADAIANQADMEIVGETLDAIGLLIAVREKKADAVILAADSDIPGLCSHLLAEYPSLVVLALSTGGGKAVLEQLCPACREITNPSAERVVAALREAVREPCGWTEGG